ncbi:MAG: ATP-NAD kinase family protein [Thermoplasmata archaeon]
MNINALKKNMKIGFIINPIAGMGGSVGLKGTDNLYNEAIKLGAKPVAPSRAMEFLQNSINFLKDHLIITCGNEMGENIIKEIKLVNYQIVHEPKLNTTREDTIECAKSMKNADIIIFVGGDGTARDILNAVDRKNPILGIPSGVKMYSAVFASSPKSGSEILKLFLSGKALVQEREVMDIDEDLYRQNKLSIKLFGYALVPYVPEYVQNSKAEIYSTEEEEDKQGIAEFFIDNMERDVLYLLGPGTTVKKINEILNVESTLLGFDALYNGQIIMKDLNEKMILNLMEKYEKVKIVLTPIGNQGFIIGRGNLQLTEKVLEKFTKDDLIILATPLKLSGINNLLVDLNEKLAEKFVSYHRVIYGYGRIKMVKVLSA